MKIFIVLSKCVARMAPFSMSALRSEVMVNFRVTVRERDTLRRLADIYGISMTTLFRGWIKYHETRKVKGGNQ